MDWDAIAAGGTCLGAAATFLAAGVALFGGRFWAWFNQPRLSVSQRLHERPAKRLPLSGSALPSPQSDRESPCPSLHHGRDARYFELAVQNCGRSIARNVRVFVSAVARVPSEQGSRWVPGYLTFYKKVAQDIPPGATRFFTFAHINDPRDSSVLLQIDRMPPNNVHDHCLPPGQYKIALDLTCNELPAAHMVVDVSCPETWQGEVGFSLQSGGAKLRPSWVWRMLRAQRRLLRRLWSKM